MSSRARWFVRAVSWLVPGGQRREFRREWEAELDTDEMAPGGGSAARQAIRVSGALPDALTLFSQEWSMDMLLQDVRYALRLARRRLGFTALVVATLAIGIGSNTAIFSVVNAVLLKPMPYPEPDRLLVVWEDDQVNRKPRYYVAPANFMDWVGQSRAFSGFCAYIANEATLDLGGDPARVAVGVVSPNFNAVTGVSPVLGRAITGEDGKTGNQRVLLLSHGAWQRYFAGDPGVLTREIKLNDAPYRIIGVMPRGFSLIDEGTQMWRPMVLAPQTASNRALHFLTVVGRIAPGVSFEQARDDLDAIAKRAQQLYPGTNDRRGITLVPIAEQMVGDVRRPLYAIAAAVGIVLLIGCANVANLLLAAGNSRRREFAVRAALGSGRARLARQLMTEGLILGALGGVAGLALAWAATKALGEIASRFLPRTGDLGMDARVLLFTAAASIATGLIFALLPALHGSRADVNEALKDGGRTGHGAAARRAGASLVVAELAMAVVLVTGASLAIRSFYNVRQVDTGMDANHVLAAQMRLPASRYRDEAPIAQFHASLLDRLRQTPGVVEAGITNALPMNGAGPTSWLTIEGRSLPSGEPPEVNLRAATSGYFSALRIPLLAGVMPPAVQQPDEPRVVVVNRTLADHFFEGGRALGARIRLGPNPKAPWRTIVGIVGDVHQSGPERPVAPEVYMTWADWGTSDGSLTIRLDGDAAAFAPALRAIVQSIDPQVAPWQWRPMRAIVEESEAGRKATMTVVSLFAAIALLLALIGVYGVMAHNVSRRIPEIGVRMALGAARRDVLLMIGRQGMGLALAGLAAGVLTAIAGGRIVRTMLFGVEPTDPVTLVGVSLTVLLVTALACYVPARRAASVDPVAALRR